MSWEESRGDNTSHSIRTSDRLWNRAKARAQRDKVSLNQALNLLLEGYADGKLTLPTVTKTYHQ